MKPAQEKRPRLHPHCILVSGASGRGAIYDLRMGRVFSVNQKAVRIIRYKAPDDQLYWRRLEELGLAGQKEKAPGLPAGPLRPRGIGRSESPLEFIWCEITSLCNERCIHCYGGFGGASEQGALPVDWESILRQGAELGCRQVQFIGGEPLLVRDMLRELVALARQLGYCLVEVFTNGTLITPEVARWFAHFGVRVAVSLYSNQPEIHDAITQQQGSFQKTSESLLLLREKAIPTRVAIIAMAQNQDTLETTTDFARSCGAYCRGPDVIRPTGRGNDDLLLPGPKTLTRYALRTRPSFSTGWAEFAEARHWNTCWKGKIAITPTGDVLPCIFARNMAAGNVNQTTIEAIIKGAILPYWHITLDQVAVCQDCEYRYACHNCRPLSQGATGSLLGSNPRCGYNPYTGEWKDGHP